MKKLLILFALFQVGHWRPLSSGYGYAPIVEGIQLERPAPHPCNLNVNTGMTMGPTSCLTGPEKYWTCADKQRVLLTSEDGKHFCMKVQFE